MKKVLTLAAAIALLVTMISVAAAETIVMKSGNAASGSQDPLITVRRLSLAAEPQQAIVASSRDALWTHPPVGCTWVSTTTSTQDIPGWYYYHTSFSLPSGFTNPSLTISWSGDDCAYLTLNATDLGYRDFWAVRTVTLNDPSAFATGVNALDFAVANKDTGWPTSATGLCYYATVTYTSAPVPEPSSILALAGGLLGLLGIRRFRR